MEDRSTETFFDRFGDRASEVAYLAGLAWIETAVSEAREGKWGRWRAFPRGELRWFRNELTGALLLLRFAAAARDDENESLRELTADLETEARAAGVRARREQTREAERVRLLKVAARREGREPTEDELYPWLASR